MATSDDFKGMNEAQKTELVSFLGEFTHDPAGFVYAAFPWGEGELAGMAPQKWQVALLDDIASGLKTVDKVIQEAVASGHGIGKSALVSWLIIWAISTYEDCKGIVTANTDTQLRTKTWAELAKWHRLFIGMELFEYTATSYYAKDKDHEKTWRVDAIPWSDSNPEAFAGLHNQGKRILVLFDEASAISDAIWEVVEGATTDKNTEIIWSCFGNPTRNSGRFYDCFNKSRNFWHRKQIDSRNVDISNKTQLQSWIDQWGIDSDFVRIRVLGKFPHAANGQLISSTLAEQAIERYKNVAFNKSSILPVLIGVDPAWTGEDKLVVYMRQGNYSKVLFEQAYTDDYEYVSQKLAYLSDEYCMQKGFIDQGYGEGIYSCLKSMGRGDQWSLIPFNSTAQNNDYYQNKRAEMWDELKKWLKEGGTIEDKQDIVNDITGPEGFINRRGKFQLEAKEDMKRRGLASPNYADALALTFAQPVITGKNDRFDKLRRQGKLRKYGAM